MPAADTNVAVRVAVALSLALFLLGSYSILSAIRPFAHLVRCESPGYGHNVPKMHEDINPALSEPYVMFLAFRHEVQVCILLLVCNVSRLMAPVRARDTKWSEDIFSSLFRLSRWLFLRADTKCEISSNFHIANSRDKRPIGAREAKYMKWPGFVFPAPI
jgi:hypothetical protein